ncbi:MAG: T9SS type A sorting domain-containing protein [Paludibacter sp.]|nr:T9SS type A sorting domain-containing protein [Paludibacter sp.]
MKTVRNIITVIALLALSSNSWGQSVVANGIYAITINSDYIRTSEDLEIAEYTFSASGQAFERVNMKKGTTLNCDGIDKNRNHSTNDYVTLHQDGEIDAVVGGDIALSTRVGWHDGFWPCSGYTWGGGNYTVTMSNKIPYYYNNTSTATDKMTIYYSLFIRPKKFQLYYFNKYEPDQMTQNQRLSGDLMFDFPITIKASKGFPNSIYNWKYSYNSNGNGIVTKTFDNSINNRDTICFKGSDILTESEMNYLIEHPNEIVTVRIDYNSIPTDYITLTPMLTAPYIENSYYLPETCNGTNDAKIRIVVSRPLRDNETLQFQESGGGKLQATVINPTEFELVPVRVLGAGQEIVQAGFEPGTYYPVILNGTYKGINTFTSSERHRDTVEVYERPIVEFSSVTPVDINCYGGSDGKINIVPTGGVDKYKAYLYKAADITIAIDSLLNLTQNNTYQFKNLLPDTYTVALVDTNNCYFSDKNQTVTIHQPQSPVEFVNISIVPLTGFETGNGKITATIAGGNGNYKVWWQKDGADYSNETLSGDIAEIDNLAAGSYRILVRDGSYNTALGNNSSAGNIAGCWIDTTVIVAQPEKLVVSVEQTDSILCFGDSAAVLIAHAKGGVQFNSGLPYTYKWFNTNNSGSILSTDSIVTGLPAGNYKVTVVDKNNNTATSNVFTVIQPELLTVQYNVLKEILCPGDSTGKIEAVVAGGTPPYTYYWYPSGKTTAIIDSIGDRTEIAYVEDGNGCKTAAQNIVVANSNSLFVRENQITHPSCFDKADGSITVEVLGGVAPFVYLWNDGATTKNRSSLKAGDYSVTVTDAHLCSFTQVFTLNQPNEIQFVDFENQVVFCKGEQASINGTVYVPNAAYKWTDDKGNTVSNDSVLTVGQAGIYTVTATTAQQCVATAQVLVIESVNEVDADFIIATKAPKYQVINAINITHTEIDSIKWIVPNNVIVISKTNDKLQLQFNANGSYTIGLIAYKGDCAKIVSKTVSIVDDAEIAFTDKDAEPFLKQFVVIPNPNNGNFTVKVELSEIADYSLTLYNDKSVVVQKNEITNSIGEETLFANNGIPSGIYFLRFVSSKALATFKIIVN